MTSSALMRARALPPSFQLHISTPVPTDGGKTLAFVLFVATQPRPMPHEFLRANVRCPFPPPLAARGRPEHDLGFWRAGASSALRRGTSGSPSCLWAPPAAPRCLVQLGLWDRTSGLSAYAEDFISEVTCGQSSSMVRQGQQAAARPSPTSADSILALTDPLKPGRGSVLASGTSTQASPSPRHSARPRASAESPSRSGELPSQVPSTLQPPAPRPGRSRKPVLARIPQGTDFEICPRRILPAHVLQNDT